MKTLCQSVALFGALGFFGCGSHATESSSNTKAIEDAASITQRSDGNYDVRCRDGRTEVATSDEIRRNSICAPLPPQPDVFSESTCPGSTISESAALALIPLPNSISKSLGHSVLKTRTRLCYSVDGCTAWVEEGPGTVFYAEYGDGGQTPLRKDFNLDIKLDHDRPRVDIYNEQWNLHGTYVGANSVASGSYYSNGVWYYPKVASDDANFSMKIANSCAWVKARGTTSTTDSSGNSVRYESEVAGVTYF